MMTFTMGLRVVVAAVALGGLAMGTTVQAQSEKMGSGMMKQDKMSGKMMAGKMSGPVYMCKDGKCYMTPADAKKVGYKDPMGGRDDEEGGDGPEDG